MTFPAASTRARKVSTCSSLRIQLVTKSNGEPYSPPPESDLQALSGNRVHERHGFRVASGGYVSFGPIIGLTTPAGRDSQLSLEPACSEPGVRDESHVPCCNLPECLNVFDLAVTQVHADEVGPVLAGRRRRRHGVVQPVAKPEIRQLEPCQQQKSAGC